MSETFENRDMTGTIFHDVNLQRARFEDVNLAGATIRNANLADFTIEDANIQGLTVFGFRVDQLIEAELDRRDPERERLRMADICDPECVRSVLNRLAEVRRDFYSLLRRTDPQLLSTRLAPDQWSVIENLRHLIFAEDMYLNRWILQNDEPWCKLGLLPDFLAGNPKFAEVGSQPTDDLEILLAAWEAIHARMMEFVATVTPDELRRDTRQTHVGQGTVGGILQGQAQHDLVHIRQVEAALSTLTTDKHR
jgi:hypothetical protein